MPNYGLLAIGQQPATTVATPLPSVVPPNPLGALGLAGGSVRGEGVQVIIENLKASTASFFYGGGNVTVGGGKEVPPGTQDTLALNDLAQLSIIAAANGTATASWSVTNR